MSDGITTEGDEPEATTEAPRGRLQVLFPNETERRLVAAAIAASIRVADSINRESWAVTYSKGERRIRLNVGSLRVFDLRPGLIRFAVDKSPEFSPSQLAKMGIQCKFTPNEHLQRLGNENGVVELQALMLEFLPEAVRRAHDALVERAAESGNSTARFHDERVLEELRSLTGLNLASPRPMDEATQEPADNTRFSYLLSILEGVARAHPSDEAGVRDAVGRSIRGLVEALGNSEENYRESISKRVLGVGADELYALVLQAIGGASEKLREIICAVPMYAEYLKERSDAMERLRRVLEMLEVDQVAAAPSEGPASESTFTSLLGSLHSKESKLWFDEELVAHYILGLEAKRFVILTGVSGTGKTQLALSIAKHFRAETKRLTQAVPPLDAVVVRVQPYMLKGRRFVLPVAVASGLSLGGMTGSGTATVDVEYPGGQIELSVYRDVRTSTSSVHHLGFKPAFATWFRAHVPANSEFFIELLEPGSNGRDRLRISVPQRQEEEAIPLRNYEVVAVRPDWTDGRGLLGFYNPLTRRYMTTPTLQLLLEATEEVARAAAEGRVATPFFLILDEMNLARVEQYFSDFLSALESGEAIPLHEDSLLESGDVESQDEEVSAVPRRIAIPPNLFVTGTVNVDETTHMFSPKVLDRAFVIEFNEVHLEGYSARDVVRQPSALRLVGWWGFAPWHPVSSDDWDKLQPIDRGQSRASVVELNNLLAEDNRHFGYRVANEIARFLGLAARYAHASDVARALALDLAFMSKVLPKLHGTQQEIEDALLSLFEFMVGEETSPEAWTVVRGRLTAKIAQRPAARFPRSASKLWRMLRRCRAQGFTTFIE